MRDKFPEAQFEERYLRAQLTAKLNKNKQAQRRKEVVTQESTCMTYACDMCMWWCDVYVYVQEEVEDKVQALVETATTRVICFHSPVHSCITCWYADGGEVQEEEVEGQEEEEVILTYVIVLCG